MSISALSTPTVSVTREELKRELTTTADAGFGGVEVAYVYPLAPATTEFGSDAFLARAPRGSDE
jgi:hypothetical protein